MSIETNGNDQPLLQIALVNNYDIFQDNKNNNIVGACKWWFKQKCMQILNLKYHSVKMMKNALEILKVIL